MKIVYRKTEQKNKHTNYTLLNTIQIKIILSLKINFTTYKMKVI